MTIEVLAQKNRETVRAFLSSTGVEDVKGLFAPEAVVEHESADRKPQVTPAAQWLAAGSWRFENTRIYTGDDPNTILAETDKVAPAGPEYLIVEFLLEDAKIKRYREIPNPTVALHR